MRYIYAKTQHFMLPRTANGIPLLRSRIGAEEKRDQRLVQERARRM